MDGRSDLVRRLRAALAADAREDVKLAVRMEPLRRRGLPVGEIAEQLDVDREVVEAALQRLNRTEIRS